MPRVCSALAAGGRLTRLGLPGFPGGDKGRGAAASARLWLGVGQVAWLRDGERRRGGGGVFSRLPRASWLGVAPPGGAVGAGGGGTRA